MNMRREGLRRGRRLPWMRPTELRDCGAAAFASVAWAAGHEVSVEEARDLVRTDNNGTHLVGLLHGGRTIGLESRAAVSDYDGLPRSTVGRSSTSTPGRATSSCCCDGRAVGCG